MNIAFFLTPKADVARVSTAATVRQAIERMEHHGYTAIPVLTPEGRYAGALTEGDLLWFMKQHPHIRFDETESFPLSAVVRRTEIRPVRIDAEIEELLARAIDQNFVPVIDDRDVFVGIVRRKTILEHFQRQMLSALERSRSVVQNA
jgi:CBS-domain-containing membrane protein